MVEGPNVGHSNDTSSRRRIVLTGGAGFIGAHTAIQLCGTGKYKAVIVDNLYNSCTEAVDVIKKLAGPDNVEFHHIDLSKPESVEQLKALAPFHGVIHFAALKAVNESVQKPLEYYDNNVNCMLNVLKAMRDVGCKNFVYSSSATVYLPNEEQLTESSALGACNPYGQTKLLGEYICKDLFVSDPSWKISILRYFNPIGAHPSGLIGEAPQTPLNILPIIQKVAVGRQDKVVVAGNDWPTPDGTGVRDYIHIMDLADGHVLALDYIEKHSEQDKPGICTVHNLGTGKGTSVLEMIAKFEKACGHKINYEIGPRRQGDLASVVCSNKKAETELGFHASRTADEACVDAWRWQSTHPMGFHKA